MTFDIDYDKAEFVGQIVDTFEDYFTDNNIIWPNPDRDAEEGVFWNAVSRGIRGEHNVKREEVSACVLWDNTAGKPDI